MRARLPQHIHANAKWNLSFDGAIGLERFGTERRRVLHRITRYGWQYWSILIRRYSSGPAGFWHRRAVMASDPACRFGCYMCGAAHAGLRKCTF